MPITWAELVLIGMVCDIPTEVRRSCSTARCAALVVAPTLWGICRKGVWGPELVYPTAVDIIMCVVLRLSGHWERLVVFHITRCFTALPTMELGSKWAKSAVSRSMVFTVCCNP